MPGSEKQSMVNKLGKEISDGRKTDTDVSMCGNVVCVAWVLGIKGVWHFKNNLHIAIEDELKSLCTKTANTG